MHNLIIKRNKFKLIILITTIALAFVVFLLLHNKSHSYEMEYSVNDIKIVEKYDNTNNYYIFNIQYNDINKDIISINKYTKSRHLIKDITIEKKNNSVCLVFESIIDIYPICKNESEYYSYYIDKQDIFFESNSYNNIKIADLNNKSYLLWNYNGFIYLQNDTKKELKMFNKDTYNIGLYYQFNNYLVLPDYNQEWMFDKVYIINYYNGRISNYTLRFPLYFDSYFLGNDNKYIYLFDKKEEQEYYLDINKLDIYKTKNQILNNGKWENVSLQKLKNKEVIFNDNKLFDYYLKDNLLYSTGDIKISNRLIDEIVKVDNLDVYYLSEGILYYYNPNKGEKALLQYSEWEFNHKNMIFIY